jgi:hypothetical protein
MNDTQDPFDAAYDVWVAVTFWASNTYGLSDEELERDYNEPVTEEIIAGLT